MRTALDARGSRPIVEPRAQAYAYERPAVETLDQAHDHHRPKRAAPRSKARAEVEHPQPIAVRVGEDRLDDRRVAQIALRLPHAIDELDPEYAALVGATIAVDQCA